MLEHASTNSSRVAGRHPYILQSRTLVFLITGTLLRTLIKYALFCLICSKNNEDTFHVLVARDWTQSFISNVCLKMYLHTTYESIGNIKMCLHTTYQSIGNIKMYLHTTYQSIGNIKMYLHTTYQSIGNIKMCLHTTYQSIGNIKMCLHTTYQSVGNIKIEFLLYGLLNSFIFRLLILVSLFCPQFIGSTFRPKWKFFLSFPG